MTDKELIEICKKLTREVESQEEFNRELKRMGINRTASVIWDSTGRMSMGMIFGISGKVLSF